MMKKILLFSLLVCTCAEVFAQNQDSFACTYGPKPYWFDDYCSDENRAGNNCLNRLTGIHKILDWNKENFRIYGETTTTMFSLETSGGIYGHPAFQRSILNPLVAGEVFQYLGISRRDVYDNLFPGAVATVANTFNFMNRFPETPFDFENVQAVVVTGTGNRDRNSPSKTLRGLVSENHDYRNLPFPLAAGGYDYSGWLRACKYPDPDNVFPSDLCRIYRASRYSCPGASAVRSIQGASVCGTQAKNLCLLGPYQVPNVPGAGTSLATAYMGGVIWAVSYFIRNYPEYEWQEPMTDLQAAVTAVAIVKSCAVDMGPAGPDFEHGLGRLSVECLNKYNEEGEHIGFIENPLSVIKDELYLVPNADYVRP